MHFGEEDRRMNSRKRILFIGEAVTLAHVVRPRVLAESLDQNRYEAILASDVHIPIALQGIKVPRVKIQSRTPVEFISVLEKTGILFDYATLHSYCTNERRLIDEIEPDVIVGDLRPSLSVSATLAKVPLVTLTNGYWSPFKKDQTLPLPYTKFLKSFKGFPARVITPILQRLFQGAVPKIYEQQGEGINRLRHEHGLSSFETYLEGFVYGDYTLYCDPPSLFELESPPSNHRFIGAIQWSPKVPLPSWWKNIATDKKVVFVNMGSSGDMTLLPILIEAVREVGGVAVVVTAQSAPLTNEEPWLYSTSFLPGEEILKRADVLICNGGSPAAYQSLDAGKPIIGIPSNMDQLLNMRALSRHQVGLTFRADTVSKTDIVRGLNDILNNDKYIQRAKQLSKEMNSMRAESIFEGFLQEITMNMHRDGGYERVYNL